MMSIIGSGLRMLFREAYLSAYVDRYEIITEQRMARERVTINKATDNVEEKYPGIEAIDLTIVKGK